MSIINGGHELMGGTIWELVKLSFFFYKEFNKKSIIWEVFFWNFQWSAVMDSIMASHVETIWNHQNPWDAIRFQLEKLM